MTAKTKRKAATDWRSRIVGHAMVDPKVLLANPLNPKVHPPVQHRVVTGSLTEIGWIKSVLVNKRNNRIVDGHERVGLAVKRKEKKVPVEYVDLNETEERLALATLDPLSSLAIEDPEQAEALLDGLSAEDAELQEFLNQKSAEASGAIIQESNGSKPGTKQQATAEVKLALHVPEVSVVERAIRATGLQNRGDAIMEVCRGYLATQGQFESEA